MSKDHRDIILLEVVSGTMSLQDACARLRIHRTTLWRLRRKWEKGGAAALRHGLSGRRSNGAKSESFRRHVCGLFARFYQPLGHTPSSFYDSVARRLPDYVCYKTVLTWLREEGLVQ